jgi:hypothetical protein
MRLESSFLDFGCQTGRPTEDLGAPSLVDWSKDALDDNHTRQLSCLLLRGTFTETEAARTRYIQKKAVQQMGNGVGPIFKVLPSYPANNRRDRDSSIRYSLNRFSDFQAKPQTGVPLPGPAGKETIDGLRFRRGSKRGT